MKEWKNKYNQDKARYPGESSLTDHSLRFLWVLRRCGSSRSLVWRLLFRRMSLRYGLEVSPASCIGGGLYLGHAFNITVNPDAIIGSCCNLHKGVTIGAENRGKRMGCPTIGDRVWVGSNAVIVGKVTIGDDVLIAPGSYVNCDAPSHSIVLGNPCRIVQRDNATVGYINNCIRG